MGTGRFFLGLLVGLLLLGAWQTGAFFALLGWKREGDALSIASWYARKDEVANQREGPRVFLVAGSSALYGVKAETMEESWEVPVINYGVHGGVALRYLLYRVRQVVRPGDFVIFLLEYSFYQSRDKLNRVEVSYYLGGDPSFLPQLGWRQFLQVFFAATPSLLVERLRDGRAGSERRQIAKSREVEKLINLWGDREEAPASSMSEEQVSARQQMQPVRILLREDLVENPAAWRELEDFVSWARQNDVRVMASFACTLDRPELHTEVVARNFAKIRQGFSAIGVEMVGDGEAALRPEEDLYDTNYHLNAEGREKWTAQLIEWLTPAVEEWRAKWW